SPCCMVASSLPSNTDCNGTQLSAAPVSLDFLGSASATQGTSASLALTVSCTKILRGSVLSGVNVNVSENSPPYRAGTSASSKEYSSSGINRCFGDNVSKCLSTNRLAATTSPAASRNTICSP